MRRRKKIVAYRVFWEGIPAIRVIVAERCRSKARSAILSAIREAGWEPDFFEVKAHRAPQWDVWAAHLSLERLGKGFSEETVASEQKMFLERLARFPGGRGSEA